MDNANKPSLIKNPSISIITPALNSSQFIDQTIKSVLTQEYKNIEFIIIDGGSVDKTIEKIKKYEKQITYWSSESDRGIADAFNKGLKVARGDYIYFLNSDDWLFDKTVIKTVAGALKDLNFPTLLYGKVNYCDRTTGEKLWSAGGEFSIKSFLNRMTIPHQGLFTKKEFFLNHGQFDRTLKHTMDYEILLRAVPHLHPKWIDLTIANVREGGTSRKNKSKNMLESASLQIKYGAHSFFYAYLLSMFYIIGMGIRDLFEILGIKISKRF